MSLFPRGVDDVVLGYWKNPAPYRVVLLCLCTFCLTPHKCHHSMAPFFSFMNIIKGKKAVQSSLDDIMPYKVVIYKIRNND